MNKIKIIIFLLISIKAYASSYHTKPYIKFSNNCQYIVEVRPYFNHPFKGVGSVYSINGIKKVKKLWNFCLYGPPYNLTVTDDGKSIIVVNSLGIGKILFANENGNHRFYNLNDLIVRKRKARATTAGLAWFADSTSVKTGFSKNQCEYTIVLADKTGYVFNVKTGEIISKFKDRGALYSQDTYKSRFLKKFNDRNKRVNKLENIDFKERQLIATNTECREEYTDDKYPVYVKEESMPQYLSRAYEVFHPKLEYYSSNKNDVFKIFGKPLKVYCHKTKNEEIWIYNESVVSSVHFVRNTLSFIQLVSDEIMTIKLKLEKEE